VNARYSSGVTTVEFAIVGMLAMVVLFAVLEVGRAMFVFNALEEATRRGARVAAVCEIGDPAIAQITVFSTNGGGSSLVGGLTTGHVAIEYLDDDGVVIGDPMAQYGSIGFVRVRIDAFEHRLIIPLFMTSFTTPGFETTLPRESLGVSRDGITPC
jgi:hypothetical protein